VEVGTEVVEVGTGMEVGPGAFELYVDAVLDDREELVEGRTLVEGVMLPPPPPPLPPKSTGAGPGIANDTLSL